MDKTVDNMRSGPSCNTPGQAPERTLKENLLRTMFKFRKLAQSVTLDLGVSFGEFIVMKGISEHSRCNEDFRISEVMEFLSVTKPAVSQMLNNLEKKGYVTRQISESDRRRIKVSLTESGSETVERLTDYFDRGLAETANRIGEDDITRLIGLLDRVESVYESIKTESLNYGKKGENK